MMHSHNILNTVPEVTHPLGSLNTLNYKISMVILVVNARQNNVYILKYLFSSKRKQHHECGISSTDWVTLDLTWFYI